MAKLCHVLPLAHLLGGTCLEGQRGARIEGGAKGIVAPCSGAVRTAESPVPSRAGFDRRYRTEGSTMSAAGSEFRKQFLIEARHSLEKHYRSEEHTSELQSQSNLVCRLLLEKKKNIIDSQPSLNHMLIALLAVTVNRTKSSGLSSLTTSFGSPPRSATHAILPAHTPRYHISC